MKKRIFYGVFLALIITMIAVFAVSYKFYICNYGIVKAVNVSVFWDGECTTLCTEIDWGVIEPNTVTEKQVFIRNDADVPIVLLYCITDWNPENAERFLTLTWNYSGTSLNINEVVPIKLFLALSSDVSEITQFRFVIWVIGEG